jgi:radical SAM enzyme (TIGR01210 family)
MIGIDYDENKNRLIVILKGFPCSWGRCIFCQFSRESTTNLEELLNTDLQIIKEISEFSAGHKVERLSIFNGGSFFELPLYVIQQLATVTKDRYIDIESLPPFIQEQTVKSAFNLLQPSTLEIRLGLESSDESIRRMLRKGVTELEIARVSKLRESIRHSMGERIRFVAYVLFGMEGISEESVIESVHSFKQLFDGVIAIRYRRYNSKMPNAQPVTYRLMSFLSKNCLDVDMTEGKSWEID